MFFSNLSFSARQWSFSTDFDPFNEGLSSGTLTWPHQYIIHCKYTSDESKYGKKHVKLLDKNRRLVKQGEGRETHYIPYEYQGRVHMGRNDLPLSVIADDRERKGEVIQFLSKMKNVSVEIKRLSVGDYVVDNRIVFERKTLNDFALSIIDGRLFRQAIRLAGSKYRSVLILEGTGKELTETGIRREAMQGALITLSLLLAIPVLRSKNPSESAHLIMYASRQFKSFTREVVQRPGNRSKGRRKRQLFILQGLPGVGGERAARLLDSFGSIQAVVTATREELQFVEGIGKHIAEKIRQVVSDQIQSYGFIDEFPI